VETILELGLLNAVLATLLALAAAALTAAGRRPALAHALWLLVLLKLVTPPLVAVTLPRAAPPAPPAGHVDPAPPDDLLADGAEEVPADLPGPAGVEDRADVREASAGPEPPPWLASWPWAVAGLWLAGSCLWWSLAALRLARFRLLLRSARPAPPEVRARAEDLAGRLGLARCPDVWLLDAPLPPFLWSLFGAPRVLLPAPLWAGLTAQQRDTLLAHELAHVRRRDHWVRWLELVALGLYWWHPVAWWARRRLQEAEELLCDARVVRALPGAAGAYAEALLKTVAFLSRPRPALPAAASGLGQVRVLKRRLTMIMRGTSAERLPRAAALAVLALGATALALRPGWAQAPAAEPPAGGTRPAAAAPAGGDAAPAAGEAPRRAAVRGLLALGQAAQAGAGAGLALGQRPAGSTQEAQDAVELLRARLEAKEAELQEARALLTRAKVTLDRSERLHKQRALSEGEMEQARSDYEVQQARLRGKEAQLREARLLLTQAERRLGRLRQGGSASARPALSTPTPVYPPAGGTGPGGLPAAVPAYPTPPGGGAPGGRATEERLRRLERQLQDLLREVHDLRQQMRSPGQQGPGGGGSGGGGGTRRSPGQETPRPGAGRPLGLTLPGGASPAGEEVTPPARR
jgi:beta-lactamase regulating signal transducer with metallopeptidase domain